MSDPANKHGRRPTAVIGILAGIAGGKTTVARMFERLGARVADADQIARRVTEQPSIRRAIRRRFGPSAFDSRGRLNRRRLGGLVFRSPAAREALNRIVHPAVHRRILEAIRRTRRRGGVLVLDVPLLLEKGLDAHCDVLVFVDTRRALRVRRAAVARGWKPSEVTRREMSQKTVNFKRRRADYIVCNNLSMGHTFRQVNRIWLRLTSEPVGGRAWRERAPTRTTDHRARGASRATHAT